MIAEKWVEMKRKERETPIKVHWVTVGFIVGVVMARVIGGIW